MEIWTTPYDEQLNKFVLNRLFYNFVTEILKTVMLGTFLPQLFMIILQVTTFAQ